MSKLPICFLFILSMSISSSPPFVGRECFQGSQTLIICGGRAPQGTRKRERENSKRNITKGSCFFCLVELEYRRHRFISCSMARMVWRCINLVWMSLTGVSLSSFNWVFAHMENNEPMLHFQIIFDFLRYWGLWFNWNMRNAFTFDSQVGVRKYVLKLKGLLFVAIDNVREVTKSKPWRERTLKGHI